MRRKFFIFLWNVKEIAHAKTRDVSSVHYNSVKHAHDICSMLYGTIMSSNWPITVHAICWPFYTPLFWLGAQCWLNRIGQFTRTVTSSMGRRGRGQGGSELNFLPSLKLFLPPVDFMPSSSLGFYTCQLSCLRRESRACELKTSISRQLTLTNQFLTPTWKLWVITTINGTLSKNMWTQTTVRNENSM